MGAFKDYAEFADPPLALPVNGKTYVIPEVGIEAGLLLAGVITGENKGFEDKPVDELWKLALGTAWDEMVADNISFKAAGKAGYAALVYTEFGHDVAMQAWQGDADPEGGASTTEAPKAGTAKRPRTRTAAASSSTASGTGTRTSRSKAK